jgi:hypothetical protein
MDKMKVLFASSGMVLTDGTNYGTAIYLAEDRAESDFYEITIEEYNRRIAEPTEEGELTKADCLEALAMLGVK